MTHLENKHIDLITTAVVVLGQHFLCWNISMWHSHPRLFTATFCFCGVCKKTVHSISILLFKQSVKGEGSAHWPTATSICVTVSVFGSVRVCVCVLNSRSNPHLLHWFTPNPPPRITSWQNDSPLWPIETQHTAFDWPAEVAINPPAGLVAQLPQVRQNPNLLPPRAHSLPFSPTLGSFPPSFASLNYSSEYISCHNRKEKSIKQPNWNTEDTVLGPAPNQTICNFKTNWLLSNPTTMFLG